MTESKPARTPRGAPRKRATVRNDLADRGSPRYLQVSRHLIAGIADGHFPLGSQLPTEFELCRQFEISRFTAREAIRVLVNAGLVVRRQRAGTTVIATPDENRYTHALSSLRDLFQYARHTELRLVYIGHVTLDRNNAREFGLTAGEEWIYATGVRRDTGRSRPFCVTRLYINPAMRGIEAKLRTRKTAVYALLEKEFGVSIDRVEQELQGIVLDVDDAANLGAAPGAPGLRIIRRYFEVGGRLVEVADNVHPSDRFSYRMQLTR